MSLYLRILFTALFISSLAASHGFAAGEVAANTAAAKPSGYAPAASKPVEGAPASAPTAEGAAKGPIKPYRTWITVQRYNMESNGDAAQPISNVRLEVQFPTPKGSAEQKMSLPESGQFWPIGNGQVQEINRNFEVPWAWIQNDGFVFTVQMVRKGAEMLPCRFEVTTLSQFNRSYVCKTDTGWQATNHIPPEKHDKESIQVRVFTDLNSKPNEIPNDAIALK